MEIVLATIIIGGLTAITTFMIISTIKDIKKNKNKNGGEKG